MGVLDSLLDKYKVDGSATKELTKPPERFKAHNTEFRASGNYPPNSVHQMDLLFLPDDKSKGGSANRYLLVVTDVGTGKTDARPLRFKKASKNSAKKKGTKNKPLSKTDKEYNAEKGVLEQVQDIYKSGKYLKEPTSTIQVDAGSEFNAVKQHFEKKRLAVRTARTGRHNQQASVEALNKMIGSTINKIQLNNQMAGEGKDEDGEVREWLIYLPDILEAINIRKMKKVREAVDDVLCRADTKECETYTVGDKVRIMLDYPKAFKGDRLYGSFRSGDIRWSLKPHTIENVLLMKNQPIRYVVSGVKDTTYNKFELKPFKGVGVVQPIKKKYEIEDLLWYVTLYPNGRKGKKAWFVKWKGFPTSANMLQFEQDLKKFLTDDEFKALTKGKKGKKLTQKQVEEFSKDTRESAD